MQSHGMELVSSTGLESTTLVLSWLQNGHLTELSPFPDQ